MASVQEIVTLKRKEAAHVWSGWDWCAACDEFSQGYRITTSGKREYDMNIRGEFCRIY